MTKLLAILAAALLLACEKPGSDSASSLEEEFRLEKEGTKDAELIASFAKQASLGDIDSLLEELDSSAIQKSGEAAVRGWLRNEVLPFFADFAALDTYETITKAALSDGRTGRMHYTYVKTSAGTLKPISVAVITADGNLRVAYIAVGKCVSGRHPRSEGRCD